MGKSILKIISLIIIVLIMIPVVIYAFPGLILSDKSYIVLSSSMEPELSPGDIIIVKKSQIEDIEVGNIVTFKSGEKTVTHRVIEITGKEDEINILTRGDAMQEADNYKIDETNLIGKVVVSFPWYGIVFLKANSLLGYILLILIPSSLIIGIELKKLISLGEKNNEKE